MTFLSRSVSQYQGEVEDILRERKAARGRWDRPQPRVVSTPLSHVMHGLANILQVQGSFSRASVFV